MKIGLRVDVDTFRGTRAGVPSLLKIFSDNRIRATFFLSVGPDNMGRHLWRLFKPAFLGKMLRSKAGKLYGWDILLRGTLWPGPVIGKELKPVIYAASKEGHEIGLHAWDHHKWQARIDQMDSSAIGTELERGFAMLAEVAGAPPTCSAVPGWKCTDQVLIEKQKFPFAYNSDCRGFSVFLPVVDGQRISQPQVPVTLPTYDEVVGRDGVNLTHRNCTDAAGPEALALPLMPASEKGRAAASLAYSAEVSLLATKAGPRRLNSKSFGDFILSRLREKALNVLTIHAEVEGIAVKDEFAKFIKKALALGHEFCPLGAFVSGADVLPAGTISEGKIPGREGWVSVQHESFPYPLN